MTEQVNHPEPDRNSDPSLDDEIFPSSQENTERLDVINAAEYDSTQTVHESQPALKGLRAFVAKRRLARTEAEIGQRERVATMLKPRSDSENYTHVALSTQHRSRRAANYKKIAKHGVAAEDKMHIAGMSVTKPNATVSAVHESKIARGRKVTDRLAKKMLKQDDKRRTKLEKMHSDEKLIALQEKQAALRDSLGLPTANRPVVDPSRQAMTKQQLEEVRRIALIKAAGGSTKLFKPIISIAERKENEEKLRREVEARIAAGGPEFIHPEHGRRRHKESSESDTVAERRRAPNTRFRNLYPDLFSDSTLEEASFTIADAVQDYMNNLTTPGMPTTQELSEIAAEKQKILDSFIEEAAGSDAPQEVRDAFARDLEQFELTQASEAVEPVHEINSQQATEPEQQNIPEAHDYSTDPFYGRFFEKEHIRELQDYVKPAITLALKWRADKINADRVPDEEAAQIKQDVSDARTREFLAGKGADPESVDYEFIRQLTKRRLDTFQPKTKSQE